MARKLSTLRTFFKYLQRQGVASQNPARLAPSPKLEKFLPHYLSVDEAFHLLGEPKSEDFGTRRDLAILEVFYGGGLRLSELAGLNLKDVDLVSGVLRVWGKGGKERLAFLGQPAKAPCRPICPCGSRSLRSTAPGTRPPCSSIPGGAACPPGGWPGWWPSGCGWRGSPRA